MSQTLSQFYQITKQTTKKMSQDQPKSHIIFIANLVTNITEEQLRGIFKNFGKIFSLDLIRRRTENTYAFIEFDDMRDAIDALESVNQREVRGKKLRIEYKSGMQSQKHEVDQDRGSRTDGYGRNDREISASKRKLTGSDMHVRGKKSQSQSSSRSKKKQDESRSRSRECGRNQREMIDHIRHLSRRVRHLESRVELLERSRNRL